MGFIKTNIPEREGHSLIPSLTENLILFQNFLNDETIPGSGQFNNYSYTVPVGYTLYIFGYQFTYFGSQTSGDSQIILILASSHLIDAISAEWLIYQVGVNFLITNFSKSVDFTCPLAIPEGETFYPVWYNVDSNDNILSAGVNIRAILKRNGE